jgi:predicted nucleic acid-binding protein
VKQKLIVDTDILIDVSREIPIGINRLQLEANNSTLAISTITQMELIVGCRNKTELQNLKKFLRRYVIIKVNELITDKAIELLSKYRLSHGLMIPDGLIAATAIVVNAPLLSKNQRDYHFISDLDLLSYP